MYVHHALYGSVPPPLHSFQENRFDTLDKFLVSHRLVECGELDLTEAVFQLIVAVEHRIIVFFHYRFNGNVVDYRQSIVDGVVCFTGAGRAVKNYILSHNDPYLSRLITMYNCIIFALKNQLQKRFRLYILHIE